MTRKDKFAKLAALVKVPTIASLFAFVMSILFIYARATNRIPTTTVDIGMSFAGVITCYSVVCTIYCIHIRLALRSLSRESTRPVGHCQDCGYDLSGQRASGRCPECGSDYVIHA